MDSWNTKHRTRKLADSQLHVVLVLLTASVISRCIQKAYFNSHFSFCDTVYGPYLIISVNKTRIQGNAEFLHAYLCSNTLYLYAMSILDAEVW